MALYFQSPERFGAAVRHLRVRQGITQGQLADRAGLGQMSVSRVESGQVCTLYVALCIVRALGMTLALAPPPGTADPAPSQQPAAETCDAGAEVLGVCS